MRAQMKMVCAVVAVVFASICLQVRADLADRIVAIVNDKVITDQEVNEFIKPAVEVLSQENANDPDLFQRKYSATFGDGLETLIENQLILKEFATKYTPLPDSAIDQMVGDRIRDQFGDRITCIRSLQAQGETFEKYREMVRDQAVISELRRRNQSGNSQIISPYKIETYYHQHQDEFKVGDEVKLRMIVLTKSAPDDPVTRKKADDILAQIKQGSSFAQLASVYSQDPGQHGSDWMETSVLRKELADAVTGLKPGQTSDVIETADNCYILRLEDKSTAHIKPLSEVRDNIQQILREQEQKVAGQRWIDGLKKKAFIRYF
jgi:peptidyl-prolyl cis-trans isomerase SurA